MDGESSCGVLREASYYKMDKLLLEMRQAKTGIQMKQQKSFFNTVSNACTGRELVSWIQKRLSIRDEIEAIHFTSMLCYLGYIIPISERQINVKNDTSCYRIQRPALWPSRKWDTASKEYVIYLMKKQIKGKSLESFEQTALQKLELMFADSWSKLNKTAKDSVDKYYIGSKGDRDIEDSQERVFWRVHRPPPGHKTHHYRSDGFNKKSICMESINQQRKVELLQTKIKFMKLYLSRSESHPEQHSEKTLVTMTNHVIQRHKHDTLLVRNDIENPWVVIDEYFYEDLLEVEDESRTKLDLESWALDFKNLLRDVYGKELFAQFLHHEYSSENLTFWDACEELKQCTQSQLNGALEKIKRNFLMPGSRHEVNLDREIVQQTLQQLETTPTRYSLDLAQQQIFSLMKRDCYPRFLKSDVYRQLFLEFIEKKR